MRQAEHAYTTPENRRQIEDQIEALITLLDGLDPDPDLEDGGDAEPDVDGEPSG